MDVKIHRLKIVNRLNMLEKGVFWFEKSTYGSSSKWAKKKMNDQFSFSWTISHKKLNFSKKLSVPAKPAPKHKAKMKSFIFSSEVELFSTNVNYKLSRNDVPDCSLILANASAIDYVLKHFYW